MSFAAFTVILSDRNHCPKIRDAFRVFDVKQIRPVFWYESKRIDCDRYYALQFEHLSTRMPLFQSNRNVEGAMLVSGCNVASRNVRIDS